MIYTGTGSHLQSQCKYTIRFNESIVLLPNIHLTFVLSYGGDGDGDDDNNDDSSL